MGSGGRGPAVKGKSKESFPGRALCSLFLQRTDTCLTVFVILIWRKLCQMPLIPLTVVIADLFIEQLSDLLEGGASLHLIADLILHMTKETLLRCVIPAVPSSGHRLPQPAASEQIPKAGTGVAAPLIRMENDVCLQLVPVVFQQLINGLENKINPQVIGDLPCENLLCIGVQNGGQISKLTLIRNAGNVREQDLTGPKRFKLPFDQVISNGIGLESLGHPPAGIRSSDRTMKIVFAHQTADFLQIYGDALVLQHHVDLSGTLFPSTFSVGEEYQFEVCSVLSFFLIPVFLSFGPTLVSGTADMVESAQLGNGKHVSRVCKAVADQCEFGCWLIHDYCFRLIELSRAIIF